MKTFTLQTVAARSFNYLENLVDSSGLPYFNVFWAKPSEAAHDWPDFGDVMSRQLQSAMMLRHMTGRQSKTETVWYERVLSYLDPVDGLLYRPKTSFSKPKPEWGDAALTLYAMVTAWLDNGESKLRKSICRMVDTLLGHARQADHLGCEWPGFMIKPLMACARHLSYEPALEAAGLIVKTVLVSETITYTPDNTLGSNAHMHASLRTLLGMADYALRAGDAVLYSRTEAIFRYVVSTQMTRFGFLPERVNRQGDIVSCETCALMDVAGMGVTLANNGHPGYWGPMERLARNHLVESQIVDASWLGSDNGRADTEQFTWRNIGARVVGGYAGWTSPNHILAAEETLPWGGAELKGKVRALQNCCGGSGVHGLFLLWKNSARVDGDQLAVHMHLDKLLPEAEIRCFQPYRGVTRVKTHQPLHVRVRVPDFTRSGEIQSTVDGAEASPRVCGNYLDFGRQKSGAELELKYPLPMTKENVRVGNLGWRQYEYEVKWKGDTVIEMTPVNNDMEVGYSEMDKRDVRIYYGHDGPGALYQRDHMSTDAEPDLEALTCNDGSLDLWYLH